MNERAKPTLEVTENAEWIRLFWPAHFDDVDEMHEDDAASTFVSELHRVLEDAGFETETAKGQRATCHGWHGFNLFRHKIGPVGTFGDLTEDEIEKIKSACFAAGDVMVAKWTNQGDE